MKILAVVTVLVFFISIIGFVVSALCMIWLPENEIFHNIFSTSVVFALISLLIVKAAYEDFMKL